MMSQLIQVHEGRLKIGTWDIAQRIGIQHRCLKGIIRRYIEKNIHLMDAFVIKERPTKKKGGQITEYLLGESETRMVLALLINHPKTPMGLNMFILRVDGPETQYFKTLEEFLGEIKELEEFVEI